MPLQTIYIIRHGDRFDFNMGEAKWKEIAQRPLDPVLSDLGLHQSILLGKFFEEKKKQGKKVTRVVTSPFVRCIQTCNPIAGAFDLPVCVDNSLWEVVFTSEVMPKLEERACYFPRIDTTYQSIFKPEPDEPFPVECMERYGKAGAGLIERFKDEEALVICTHAAGVAALVASLLKASVGSFKPVAPAAIFALEATGDPAKPWRLDMEGYNEHLGKDALGETYAWPDPAKAKEDTWGYQFLEASKTASWLE